MDSGVLLPYPQRALACRVGKASPASARFVQIGNFRLAETDDSQRLPLQFMRYRDDGTWERRTLETFQRDGGHSLNNDDHDGRIHAINSRKVFGQGCKNIGELAHGECSESFASWGDRFIQLGNWRLAALDADHFSISHKDGQNAIYKSNGHFYWERVSDRAWRRSPPSRVIQL